MVILPPPVFPAVRAESSRIYSTVLVKIKMPSSSTTTMTNSTVPSLMRIVSMKTIRYRHYHRLKHRTLCIWTTSKSLMTHSKRRIFSHLKIGSPECFYVCAFMTMRLTLKIPTLISVRMWPTRLIRIPKNGRPNHDL